MYEINEDKIRNEIKGKEIDNINQTETLNKLNELNGSK